MPIMCHQPPPTTSSYELDANDDSLATVITEIAGKKFILRVNVKTNAIISADVTDAPIEIDMEDAKERLAALAKQNESAKSNGHASPNRITQFVRSVADAKQRNKYLDARRSLKKRGPVPLHVLNFRHIQCHGTTIEGERVQEPCRHRYESNRGVFCKSCSCPEWKTANLTVERSEIKRTKRKRYFKLEYPALACPVQRWSAYDSVEPTEQKKVEVNYGQ